MSGIIEDKKKKRMKPATAPSARKVQAVLGPRFTVLEFDAGTRTAEDAAAAIGCTAAEIAKSLVFRSASGRSVLAIASGANRVDEKKAAALIGERIARADADFVRETTGFAIGGVPPVGHATAPIVLIDETLMDFAELWAAAGTPNAGFLPDARRPHRADRGNHRVDRALKRAGTEGQQCRCSDHGGIRIGVGGWNYDPWIETFYPNGLPRARQLEYASRTLTSIEIDSTYYGGKTPKIFRAWRDATPEDFVFAVKGSRFVTNRRVLAEAGPSMERFFSTGRDRAQAEARPDQLAVHQNQAVRSGRLRRFPGAASAVGRRSNPSPRRRGRHDSFRTANFVELVRARGVAVVTAADGEFPLIADVAAPFVYARIMGTCEEEATGYSDGALETWAGRARTWARGEAPDDLATLQPHAKANGRDVFLYVISGFKALESGGGDPADREGPGMTATPRPASRGSIRRRLDTRFRGYDYVSSPRASPRSRGSGGRERSQPGRRRTRSGGLRRSGRAAPRRWPCRRRSARSGSTAPVGRIGRSRIEAKLTGLRRAH